MITLLLILALLAPAPPAALPVAATLSGDGLTVTWRPPTGQARACVYRETGRDELLGCVEGRAGVWRRRAASLDAGLRVHAGDVVTVRAYSADWSLRGQGSATAAWRLWLLMVGRGERPDPRGSGRW